MCDIMHTARSHRSRFILFICLLLLLGGCASQKKVTPPKPAAAGKSTTATSSAARTRPPADRMANNRQAVSRPAVEDRQAGKSAEKSQTLTTQSPSSLKETPIEEHDLKIEPVVKERPPVAVPPVGGPPVGGPAVAIPPAAEEQSGAARKPPVEERPAESPARERPTVTEPAQKEHVAAEPREEAPASVEPPQDDYKPITGRAAAIYNQAEEAMQAGNNSSAEILLERALRIEPRNAHYWYTLGLTKFRQKQYPQAVQFCLKAESLAGSQPGLIARNQVLLAQAKKAAGMQ